MQRTRHLFVILALVTANLPGASAADAGKDNETLLRATSPFEDMVEFALARNAPGIAKSLAAADRRAAAVKEALPPPAAAKFDGLLQVIHRSATEKEHY